MLSRRELLRAGAPCRWRLGNAAAAQRDVDNGRRALTGIRNVLDGIRRQHAVRDRRSVNDLRIRQRNFFRLNQRFPECIDIGIRVWERMQDWHIAHFRPLTIQRSGDGHWQMDFIMSVLVLKHELPENEIGNGYDR